MGSHSAPSDERYRCGLRHCVLWGRFSVVQAGRDCEAHWLVGRSGVPVSDASLAHRVCWISLIVRFAGILYVYYVKEGSFETNLTPTHSLGAGLSIRCITANFVSGRFCELRLNDSRKLMFR